LFLYASGVPKFNFDMILKLNGNNITNTTSNCELKITYQSKIKSAWFVIILFDNYIIILQYYINFAIR
jgi:hypothetical protein